MPDKNVNNDYFKIIFNSAKIGIIITDDKLKIINFNNEVINIFDCNSDDLYGKSIKTIFNERNLNNIIDSNNLLYRETLAIKKNLTKIPIQYSISKFKTNNNNQYTFIINDFSLVKNKESKLKYYAFYDHLTNLANRTLFYDRCEIALNQAKRSTDLLSLLFIDLDDFKKINDKYGHEVGDEVLKNFSETLINSARESDTVARLGGDEFTILMPRINSNIDPIELSKRILNTNNIKTSINGIDINIKCSIGISIYPENGNTIKHLLQYADKAMYIAKQQGTNLYSIRNK
jgi:two-component system CheB/CheR fusion protein